MNLWEMLKASKGLPADDYMARLFALKTAINDAEDVTVSGVPCVLKNSAGKPVVSYNIYGNTMQDGTPTPENPVEVQSVGELITDGENSGKYAISVVCRGKNLVPTPSTANGWATGYLTATGSVNSPSSSRREWASDFVYMGFAKEKSISIHYTTFAEMTDESWIGVGFFDKDKNFISRTSGNFAKYQNVAIPSSTEYFRISARFYTNENIEDVKIQLELGDTATEYEPYREPIKTNILLNEPLRKIGDYADFIDFENGRIVRNIGKKVFDGTEEFLPHSSLKGWFQSTDSTVLANKPAYCTHFLYINSATSMNAGQFTTANTISDAGRHVFRMSGDTTLEDFKNFLASEYAKDTPVVVYYTLAEPTEENVILPEIPTFKGTATIETDTEIQPSGMEITYKSRRKKL